MTCPRKNPIFLKNRIFTWASHFHDLTLGDIPLRVQIIFTKMIILVIFLIPRKRVQIGPFSRRVLTKNYISRAEERLSALAPTKNRLRRFFGLLVRLAAHFVDSAKAGPRVVFGLFRGKEITSFLQTRKLHVGGYFGLGLAS